MFTLNVVKIDLFICLH